LNSEDREQQELLKTVMNYTDKVKDVDKGKRDEISAYFNSINKSRLLDTCLEIIEIHEKLNANSNDGKKQTMNVGVSLNLVVDVFYEFSFNKAFRGRMMQMNVIQKLSSLIVATETLSIKLKCWLVIFRIVSSTPIVLLPDL